MQTITIPSSSIESIESTHPSDPQPSIPSAHPIPPTNPSPRRGRRTLCTEENIARICAAIRENGSSDSAAAVRSGISVASVSRWKRDHEDLDLEFNQAREEFRDSKLTIVHQATLKDGRPDWRAAAWLLERIFPADYARRRPSAPPKPTYEPAPTPPPAAAPILDPASFPFRHHRPWHQLAREIQNLTPAEFEEFCAYQGLSPETPATAKAPTPAPPAPAPQNSPEPPLHNLQNSPLGTDRVSCLAEASQEAWRGDFLSG